MSQASGSAASDATPRVARWAASGASVRGASHVRDGSPNQDAIATWVDQRGSRVTLVSIADGHGSPRHFRSALGARFAVDASIDVLRDHAVVLDTGDEAMRARIASVDVPQRIVELWTERTRAHLEDEPLTDDELERVAGSEGPAAADEVRDDPLLAYGATVLAALVGERCIVLTQLGDGDILAVDFEGRTTRPLPADERLSGNLTTSICRAGAESDFRSIVLARDASQAALLLSTDGYANSFRSDADFLQVGSDFVAMIRKDGIEKVEGELEAILQDASTHGSGDDITLGIVQCIDGEGRAIALGGSSARRTGTTAPAAAIGAKARLDPVVAAQLAHAEHRASRLRILAIAAIVVALAATGYAMRDRIRGWWTPAAPHTIGDTPKTDGLGKPGGLTGAPVGGGKWDGPVVGAADRNRPDLKPDVPGKGGTTTPRSQDGGLVAAGLPHLADIKAQRVADRIEVRASVDFTGSASTGCRLEAQLLDAHDQPIDAQATEVPEPVGTEARVVPVMVAFAAIKDTGKAKTVKAKDLRFVTTLACGVDRVAGPAPQRVPA